MDEREKRKIREWAKNLPYLFASCGVPDSVNMAKELVELLKEQEEAYQGSVELLRQKTILFDDAIKRLKEQEAVVRCKDCKFYPNGNGSSKWLPCMAIITPPCWFCADGERRMDDA